MAETQVLIKFVFVISNWGKSCDDNTNMILKMSEYHSRDTTEDDIIVMTVLILVSIVLHFQVEIKILEHFM